MRIVRVELTAPEGEPEGTAAYGAIGATEDVEIGALPFWLERGWKIDANSDDVADDAGGSGTSSLPAAQTFTTVLTENYENPGDVTYTAMVIPSLAGYVFGAMREGDAYPFLAVTGVGDWVIGDGTYDPTNHPFSWIGLQKVSAGMQFRGGGNGYVEASPDGIILGGGGLLLRDLPTADPVVAGAVWNDAGTLKISAGP